MGWEEGISPDPLRWEAGGGPLTNPNPLVSLSPTVASGPAAEAVVEWDVSPWINTALW